MNWAVLGLFIRSRNKKCGDHKGGSLWSVFYREVPSVVCKHSSIVSHHLGGCGEWACTTSSGGCRRDEQQRRVRTPSLKFFQWLHVFWPVAQRVGCSWQGWHWLGIHRLCRGTQPRGRSEDLDMASPGLCWAWQSEVCVWGWCPTSQWRVGLHHFFCPLSSRAPITHSSQFFGILKIPKICILVQNLHE